jgi:hypothetical protein
MGQTGGHNNHSKEVFKCTSSALEKLRAGDQVRTADNPISASQEFVRIEALKIGGAVEIEET